MFTVALFTIARKWKQHKCPSTDEWKKKLWYIYTMEYYSAIKGINLEPIIQSEVNQKEKDKYRILTHISEMATRCSVLAWRIPGTGEPGGLLSMGSHTFGHD